MLTAGAIAPAVEHIASLKRGSHQRAGPEKTACRPGKLANSGPKYRRRSEPGAAEPPSGRSDSVPLAGRPVITGPERS